MRKFIIAALVLVVIGVGVSLLLIPSESDVAVMQARDTQTVVAQNVDVEAEYAQGRRSFPIVSALADKRIAEGNRPEAIRILEEYVASTPSDVQGRKKLAEQYQLAGENAKYNEQLEAIATAEPTEENLRVLSDIYNADKNYPKQEEVLVKLLDVTKGEKPQVFVDLATIQVVNGKKDDAMKTIADLKAKHPTFEDYAVVRIEVNIRAEKGEIDQAYALAKAWVDRPLPALNDAAPVAPQVTPPSGEIASPANPASQRAKELADLTNILHYSGHADKAVALVEPHLELLPESTELVVAYVNANITIGRDDHAWAILTKIDEAGKMTPELYHPYLQLAIKREDSESANAIAQKLDPMSFSEEQALNIIELARAMDAKPTLDILLTRFKQPPVVEGKPVLDAVIALLQKAKDEDKKVETALNTELSSLQRLRLAEACVRASKKQCFDTIVSRFPAVPEQTASQVAEYAQLYIIANRPTEVIEPVGQRAAATDAHPDVVFAHVKLAAAAGREDITKPWLEANAGSAPFQKLHELFYTASDHRQYAVASDIAERLYARDPSPMNREIMISALISAGQNDKALPLLRESIAQDGSNDGLYLATLSKVARKDAAARKELADYAQASLQADRGSESQQINYAYILLNNGRRDVVMPVIQQNAKTKGGEWRKMQAQLTARGTGTGAPALSPAQMIAIANNPKTSALTKRQMAFGLLKAGKKDEATKIFQQLAETKGPQSQEVKDLLYMWGGKLNAEQLAWLQKRSNNANGYDKQQWGDIIAQYGDDRAIMQYVGTTPDALYNSDLRKKYFRTVAATNNPQNYDNRMRDWVAQTTDVPALEDYAEVAQAYGYDNAATSAYKRIEQLDPNNAKALAALSAASMQKGSYSSAEQYVNRSLSAPGNANPAQTHFYKAELLKRQGNMPAAQAEYAQVVQATPVNAATPTDALSRYYTAQFHLGNHAAAKQGFEQLLAAHPDDKGVLADYMAALIEYKYFDDATRIANQYDKSSPYYGRTSAIHGQSGDVADIQQLSNGREMKISFNQPIEDRAPVDIARVQKLGWVEQASLGYDSMTVSAKPGYMVRFVPTASEQWQVAPVETVVVAPQVEMQRQQDLRLQLLYARIEQETGQTERAQQRLAALRHYYPNDPQLLGYTASVQAAEGNTEEAIGLYTMAQQLSPENEDYARTVRDLRNGGGSYGGQRTIAQYLKIDHEYRNYGANHEHITTLSGVARVGDRNELGFNLMNDRVNPKGFQDPATGLVTRKSDNFQAGELFLGHYFDGGDRLQASLFANEDTPGAGLYYAFNNSLGRSELLGEYHKPYWDFPEAVYGIATRDRVGLKHYGNINKTLTYGIETSLNNYNVEVMDDVAQTGLFRLSLQQQLQPQTASQPYLGIGYGFDGEYLMGATDTRAVNGTGPGSYHPFPFKSRENHQIAGLYRDDWTDSTHAFLLGGWLFDRLGENGPVVEGRINQDITDSLEAGVRARYGLASSANGTTSEDDAVNLGAHLMYKF
jgi:tetratricopeptide (TPR) repeat protein